MSTIIERLGRFAPDVTQTIKRFPLASALLAALALVLIAIFNNAIPSVHEERWVLLCAGLAVGAVCAAAGTLFAEGRTRSIWTHLVEFGLPLAIVTLYQVDDHRLLILWLLPFASLLWLSLSPSMATPRAIGADFYWWSNSRAIPSAIIAVFAGALIVAGLFAINWSLTRLFTVELSWLFERWLLPVICALLIPLYWLSTAPHREQFAAQTLISDDFLIRAIGMIGQFVLIPFALVYAVILHAYAVQIAISGAMPDGVVGPMVLYYQIAGLATWVLVHPAFVSARPIVQLFRRTWFYLSIIPLALFAYAVWIRLDAYGLTPSRVLLVIFGLWAIALCAIFLLTRGRADIRLIPGLAAVLFVAASFGPLAPENLARSQQFWRFETLLAASMTEDGPVWTDKDRQSARAAFDYLIVNRNNDDELRRILEEQGIAIPQAGLRSSALYDALDIARVAPVRADRRRYIDWTANFAQTPLDLGDTPYFLGEIWIGSGPQPSQLGELAIVIEGDTVSVARGAATVGMADLGAWLAQQGDGTIENPIFDIVLDSGRLRLVIGSLSTITDEALVTTGVNAWVFGDQSAIASAPDPQAPDR